MKSWLWSGPRSWPCSWPLLILLLSWFVDAQRPAANKRHDVYVAGFFPFGGRVPGSIPEGRVGRGVMPAVKLAVEHINENPTVLRNYRLHVWWNDTEVSERQYSIFQIISKLFARFYNIKNAYTN